MKCVGLKCFIDESKYFRKFKDFCKYIFEILNKSEICDKHFNGYKLCSRNSKK